MNKRFYRGNKIYMGFNKQLIVAREMKNNCSNKKNSENNKRMTTESMLYNESLFILIIDIYIKFIKGENYSLQ